MSKERLDVALTGRGLAESREKAQKLILAGKVRVNGSVETKAGRPCPPDAVLYVEPGMRYVSRGGEKLARALEFFDVHVSGKVCLDVGSSTGGFTDCLLQNGAARVYAVDVGRGQLHWRLRNDSRVILREGVNARNLGRHEVPEQVEFACVDVAFISLTQILPAVRPLLMNAATLVTLIKPQFEAGRSEVQRGGVVRDPEVRGRVVEAIRQFGVCRVNLEWVGVCESPLLGPAGNVEFLACWKVSSNTETAGGDMP